MAFDTIQFVDSVASSPTVRLDLNDESPWKTRVFSAPPPEIRRTVTQNAMRDGGFVGASTYDFRYITVELDLVTSAQDDNAAAIQELARELDRETNILKYQPVGATKPVFFKTFRSDVPLLEAVQSPSAFHQVTVELIAEPFALGLRETLGPYTINNDPAHATNPCRVDLTGIIGDVAADPLFHITSAHTSGPAVIVAGSTNASDIPSVFQAESMTLGTDTTNPGGGPDAAMSGSGTNNYVRCSFATNAASAIRVQTSALTNAQVRAFARTGLARVLAIVRRSDATSEMTLQARISGSFGAVKTLPLSTDRMLVDLGALAVPSASPLGTATEIPLQSTVAGIYAARVSGTGTLDFDCIWVVPSESAAALESQQDVSTAWVIDAASSVVGRGTITTTTLLDGTGAIDLIASMSGGLPRLTPDETNRVYWWQGRDDGPEQVKSESYTMNVFYHPRYFHTRPVAS